MSQKHRPVPTLLTICDLCDEPITERQSVRTSSVSHGYGGHPEREKATAWYLLWDPRNWGGFTAPTWEERRADPKRWGSRHYDFHTECLLHGIEELIAARTKEDR